MHWRGQLVKTGRVDCYFNMKTATQTSRDMKNQRNVTPPKHNNLPVTDPQDMDIHDLPNKDTKIAVVRKLIEL